MSFRWIFLLALATLSVRAWAQPTEEQEAEWTERLTAVYTAENEEEAVKLAKEMYRWLEEVPALQTYDKYLMMKVIFTSQAPVERLAAKCDEQYQELLGQEVTSMSNAGQQWYQDYYPNLFNAQSVGEVRRIERFLRQHENLQDYNNYCYLAYGYERVGAFAEAEEFYEKAMELQVDPSLTYQSMMYYTNFLIRSGDFLRAQEKIEQLKHLAETASDYLSQAYHTEWMTTQTFYYLYTGDYHRFAAMGRRQSEYLKGISNGQELPCDPYSQGQYMIQAQAYEELGMYDSARYYWEQADAASLEYQLCTHREEAYPDQLRLPLLPEYQIKRGQRPPGPIVNQGAIDTVEAYYASFEAYATMEVRYQHAIRLGYLGAEGYPDRINAMLKEMRSVKDFGQSSEPWAHYAYLRTRDGDYAEAWSVYQELFEMNIRWINDLIFTFGEQAFVAYYNANLKQGYDAFHSLVRVAQQNQPSLYPHLVGQGMDNLLLIKSLAFKGAQRRKEAFLRSQRPEVQALYENWLTEKQRLVQVYQRQMASDTLGVPQEDSVRALQELVNNLENRLANEADGFREQLQVVEPRWQDLQRRLAPGEAAIEWVRFSWKNKVLYSDTAYYAAYILRAESRQPEVVYLPTVASELETTYYAGYSNSIAYRVSDRESYRQFWQPLEDALQGIEKVYVANDGIFHLINLSTLYLPDQDQYLGETLDIQYLTSTANLLEEAPERLLRRALLVGRPAYELEANQADEHQETVQERNFVATFRDLDIADLPGTEDEVSNLSALLSQEGVEVTTLLGAEATEDALYAYPQPSVLHIATHGYWNQLGYQATEGFRTFNAMVNSGLLLSGVVNYYRAPVPAYTHDGVLTAYEATTLNLQGTELVVLSACETGLGFLDAGEGVYGLQRAFRAAGARSTLTSLWKVDDQATQLFMTTFYKNYLQGVSKLQAWQNAQSTLRQQYPEPYYWGAFVLVGR